MKRWSVGEGGKEGGVRTPKCLHVSVCTCAGAYVFDSINNNINYDNEGYIHVIKTSYIT